MSLNVTEISMVPIIVNAGANFLISVLVYDDAFEFSNMTLVYDEHQGFADVDQIIGGKLQ